MVHIESNISEAHVFADDHWIGTASSSPFVVGDTVKQISVVQPELDLWLSKPFIFELGSETEYVLKANFVPIPVPNSSQMLKDGMGVRVKRKRWIGYTAAGTSVLAGMLAIHYRTKAHNRFEDYLETGSPALKKRVQRLDIQSGVALGVMQVGVGVIAFRLVF